MHVTRWLSVERGCSFAKAKCWNRYPAKASGGKLNPNPIPLLFDVTSAGGRHRPHYSQNGQKLACLTAPGVKRAPSEEDPTLDSPV